MDDEEKLSKEKELARIDTKIVKLSNTLKGTVGMSPYMQDRRNSLLKELRNLKYQRIDLLNEISNYEDSMK